MADADVASLVAVLSAGLCAPRSGVSMAVTSSGASACILSVMLYPDGTKVSVMLTINVSRRLSIWSAFRSGSSLA